jgi:flagellar hook-associated protein 2
MGSPVTMSGFNNIDFSIVLNAVMQQQQAPLLALQQQQKALQAQATSFSSLSGKLAALETAADALKDPSTVGGRSVSTTDEAALSLSVSATTPTGTYDIVVQELARAQVTQSTTTAADPDTTAAASAGTLTIGGVAVTVAADSTLDEVAGAINGTDGIGVAAAVIRNASGTYQLVLTGTSTGAASGFTVDAGTTGLAFGAATVAATDAQVTVNGVTITSATNVIEGGVPGATVTLFKKDPAATITATVGLDNDATKLKVEGFVKAFNDVIAFFNAQNASAARQDSSSIARDPLVRSLRSTLRGVLTTQYPDLGSYTALSQVGVEFQRDGTLKFNERMFDDAATAHLADVTKILAGTATQGGAFDAIAAAIEQYTQTGGLLPDAQKRIDAQVASMSKRIDAMNERLAIQRAALQRQMTAADMTITQLNQQAGSLAQLSSSYQSL